MLTIASGTYCSRAPRLPTYPIRLLNLLPPDVTFKHLKSLIWFKGFKLRVQRDPFVPGKAASGTLPYKGYRLSMFRS